MHERHEDIDVPDGDLLLITGDLLLMDKGIIENKGIEAMKKVNNWLGKLPHKYKVLIAGNHDITMKQLGPDGVRKLISNGIYLENSATQVFDKTIYGCPCSIKGISPNRAWQFKRTDSELQDMINQIPENTDILLTHGMPRGFGDKKNIGCDYLLKRVQQIKPKYHVFGHLHSSHGVTFSVDTVFINAASLNGIYCATHYPIVFDM